MEPQLPSPSRSPETGPAHFPGGESIGGVPTPESRPNPNRIEREETREQHVGGASGDPITVPQTEQPALPPLPTIAPQQAQTTPKTDDTNPATAGDEDLIEKEWVEKAKQVISATKHDPYLQEQEVSKLQADYLKKRYGKTINLPTDG